MFSPNPGGHRSSLFDRNDLHRNKGRANSWRTQEPPRRMSRCMRELRRRPGVGVTARVPWRIRQQGGDCARLSPPILAHVVAVFIDWDLSTFLQKNSPSASTGFDDLRSMPAEDRSDLLRGSRQAPQGRPNQPKTAGFGAIPGVRRPHGMVANRAENVHRSMPGEGRSGHLSRRPGSPPRATVGVRMARAPGAPRSDHSAGSDNWGPPWPDG